MTKYTYDFKHKIEREKERERERESKTWPSSLYSAEACSEPFPTLSKEVITFELFSQKYPS